MKKVLFFFIGFVSIFSLFNMLCTTPGNPFNNTDNVSLTIKVPQKNNGLKWCVGDEVLFKVKITLPHLVSKVVADYDENSEKDVEFINTTSTEEENIIFKRKFSKIGKRNVEFTTHLKDKSKKFDTTCIIEIGTFPKILNDGMIQVTGELILGNELSLFIKHEKCEAVEYQWFKDGTLLPQSDYPLYNFPKLSLSDDGKYKCAVLSDWGSDTSKIFNMNLEELNTPPVILIQPSDKQITEGNSAEFTVVGKGYNLEYQWQKDEKDISGADQKSYETEPVSVGDDAEYRCVITNNIGSVNSNSAKLTVLEKGISPKINTQPKDVKVKIGERVIFYIVAEGTDLKFQWLKNGKEISGATSDILDIKSAKIADNNKKFKCIVSNEEGEVESKEAKLKVIDDVTKPEITEHPKNKEATVGSDVVFAVVAIGPDLKYQWQKNGKNIPDATKSQYKHKNVKKEDDGLTFLCIVSNNQGSATSEKAKLKVVENIAPPKITEHPKDITVKKGEDATFSIEVKGTNLEYQWKKDDKDIPNANLNSLKITSVEEDDDKAEFLCVVSNSAGKKKSKKATLTVNWPPKITKQPKNLEVKAGEEATFSVDIEEGNPKTTTFKWKDDKGNTIGSEKECTFEAKKQDNNKNIYCIVSNDIGEEKSEKANLEVYYVEITKQPKSPGDVDMGKSFSISVGAEGNPSPKYEWLLNGSKVGSSAKYSVSNASEKHSGSYSCKVYNSEDCEVTSKSVSVNVKDIVPNITQDPNDQEVTLSTPGGSKEVSFSVKASGTNLKYEWYGVSNAPNSPNINVNVNKNHHNNDVYCKVSNSEGSVTSESARLTIYWPPNRPKVNNNNISVVVGNSITLKVVQSNQLGNPPVNYSNGIWLKGNNQIGSGKEYFKNDVTKNDAGYYYFSIKWSMSSTPIKSNRITVNVKDKPNNKPVVKITGVQPAENMVGNESSVMAEISDKDPNDKLSWRLYSSPSGHISQPSGTGSPDEIYFECKKAGSFNIILSVSDNKDVVTAKHSYKINSVD